MPLRLGPMPVSKGSLRSPTATIPGSLFTSPVCVDAPAVPRHVVVLSSSSSGNCSALIHGEGATRRVTLIDAGLSPRRTRLLLSSFGLTLDHVDDVLVTHLDADHCCPTWARQLPAHARLHVHKRHVRRGMRSGVLEARTEVFEDSFELRAPGGSVRVRSVLASHDELGTAAFRFDFDGASTDDSLGWATDVGGVTGALVDLLQGVGVLAIESNYCPRLEAASGRPEVLKQRIMGGKGHLSNQQSADAVRAIAPRRHVVLLHLSRECNRPELAAAEHAGAPYGLTIAHPSEPTTLVRIA